MMQSTRFSALFVVGFLLVIVLGYAGIGDEDCGSDATASIMLKRIINS